MRVLMISPGFPDDMPNFTKGLAETGVEVVGVGDQPEFSMDPRVAASMLAYLYVPDLWNEDSTADQVEYWLASHGASVDRVECLWEPGVVLAAKLRQRLGVEGLSVEQAVAFRDKETMKRTLDAAGIRTPHHYRARSEHEVFEAAERVGFPLVVKPIAGAGSSDTYTAVDESELTDVVEMVRHVSELSVEEFIEGEEFTYDTVSGGGEVLYENVTWYRPKPLVTRLNPWVSQTAISLRDLEAGQPAPGVELGRKVLKALGYEAGFAHMEWFLTPTGEAVFGEIGARSPGGRLTHAMNFSSDIDLFRGWAEAVTFGRLSQDKTKHYNTALVFKRASGGGSHITHIEGLEPLLAAYSEHVPVVDLVRVGERRRDWRKVVTGDGWIVVRHPDLATTMEIADRLASEVRVVAG